MIDDNMLDSKEKYNAIHTLVLSASRLRRLSLPENVLDPLIDLASLVTLRRHFGENRPSFIGFIGCTGTGKSTLFNSLAGQEISLTSWKIHNTSGPVILMQDSSLKRLNQWETKFGPLLLPFLKREVHTTEKNGTFITENKKTGLPDTLLLLSQKDKKYLDTSGQDPGSYIFVDLPDINTSLALEENLVSLRVLPWLDIVIFMVDDETIFHRIYEQPVNLTNELGQYRFCVLSNRGKDRVEFNHQDIKQTMAFFGVAEIHILPELKEKEYFDNEPAFIRFKQTIAASYKLSPQKPLVKRISRLARLALEENTKREQVLKILEKEISNMINTSIVKDSPISLEKILHDDVLQVLKHLGLKRFAVSNLFHFLKTTASTGSLKRSFKLSFGNRRDKILSSKLRFDQEKLVHEVSKRLADHRERILLAIRCHADIDIIKTVEPAFNKLINRTINAKVNTDASQSFNLELQAIVKRFEQKCSDLLASDSVSAIIRNDPLVAAFLVAALAADAFTIHGFGSWLLVPTAFKYLPLGKFEDTKKGFQQEVRDLIQKQLLLIIKELQDIRFRIVLEGKDPLLQSLKQCAENDKQSRQAQRHEGI